MSRKLRARWWTTLFVSATLLLVVSHPAAAVDREQVLGRLTNVKNELENVYRPLRIFYVMGIKTAKLDESGNKEIGNSGFSPNGLIASFVGLYNELEGTRAAIARLENTIRTKKELTQSDLDEVDQRLKEFDSKLPELDKVLDFIMDFVDTMEKKES